MAEFIPFVGQGLGARLGSAFGTGLGTGLQQQLDLIANQKAQRLAAGNAAQGLQVLGFAPEEAQQISFLDPAIQKEIVKQRLAQPGQEAYAQALGQLLGQPQEAQATEIAQPQPLSVPQQVAQKSTLSPQQREQMAAYLKTPEGQKQFTGAKRKALEEFLSQPQLQPGEKPTAKPKTRLTEKQATKLAELGLKKQAAEQKEKVEAYKLSKDERKQIIDSAKAARQSLHDLERMEDLEKEGKLDTPGYVEFLKRSGLDIPSLMNPGSEEFNKIAANFLRGAREVFGSRISNYEVEQFLRTLPNLSQSPEGRKRVIANLKYINRASLEYRNALKEVLAENKGVPPLDFAEKIDDKIENKLDKISKQFKADLLKPVPPAQHKAVTALQATLGSAAQPLLGAATGAALGSLVPGIGTAIGAGVGALGAGALKKLGLV